MMLGKTRFDAFTDRSPFHQEQTNMAKIGLYRTDKDRCPLVSYFISRASYRSPSRTRMQSFFRRRGVGRVEEWNGLRN